MKRSEIPQAAALAAEEARSAAAGSHLSPLENRGLRKTARLTKSADEKSPSRKMEPEAQ